MSCVVDEGSTVSTAVALASFAMGTLRVVDTVPLPDELLIHVFSYLGPRELAAASLVARQWRRAADCDLLWERVCVEGWRVWHRCPTLIGSTNQVAQGGLDERTDTGRMPEVVRERWGGVALRPEVSSRLRSGLVPPTHGPQAHRHARRSSFGGSDREVSTSSAVRTEGGSREAGHGPETSREGQNTGSGDSAQEEGAWMPGIPQARWGGGGLGSYAQSSAGSVAPEAASQLQVDASARPRGFEEEMQAWAEEMEDEERWVDGPDAGLSMFRQWASRVGWKEVYRFRLYLERIARDAVHDMAWPLRRSACMKRVLTAGNLVVEELERLAESGDALSEGTRYFAREAMQRLHTRTCVLDMRRFLASPAHLLDEHVARGALIIAKLRYRDLDTRTVEWRLAATAEILRGRLAADSEVQAAGGPATPVGAVAAVRCLNRLLFGTPMRAAQQQQQRPAVAPQQQRHHLHPTPQQQPPQPVATVEAIQQRPALQRDEGDAGRQAAGAAERVEGAQHSRVAGVEQQRRDPMRGSEDGAGTSEGGREQGVSSRGDGEGREDERERVLQAQEPQEGRSTQAVEHQEQQQHDGLQQQAPAVVNAPVEDGEEAEDPDCLYLDGNREDYFNPRNSYINDVLDSRRGIPISLAVIHAAVGRAAGIPVRMVGVPMHFLTKVGDQDSPQELFVDCFNRRTLLRSECIEMIRSMHLEYHPRLLSPVAVSSVLLRMCNNLLYTQSEGDADMRPQSREVQRRLLPLLDLLLEINPAEVPERFNKAKLLLAACDFEAVQEELQILMRHIEGGGMPGAHNQALLQQFAENAEQMRQQHELWCAERYTPRPPSVEFRVGSIVRHRRYGYRAVVFGWDPQCTADEAWIAHMQVDRLRAGRQQPFYRLLVDIRDRRSQSTYVAQENLVPSPEMAPIQNTELGEYFMGLRGGRYVPNEYLRFRYPEDYTEPASNR